MRVAAIDLGTNTTRLLVADVVDDLLQPGSRVLYAHLGGQPALNGYAGAF